MMLCSVYILGAGWDRQTLSQRECCSKVRILELYFQVNIPIFPQLQIELQPFLKVGVKVH